MTRSTESKMVARGSLLPEAGSFSIEPALLDLDAVLVHELLRLSEDRRRIHRELLSGLRALTADKPPHPGAMISVRAVFDLINDVAPEPRGD